MATITLKPAAAPAQKSAMDAAVRGDDAQDHVGQRELLLRPVKRTPRSQWNGGFGADSGPSRGDPFRPAIRPIEASKAAVCYVRNTCAP